MNQMSTIISDQLCTHPPPPPTHSQMHHMPWLSMAVLKCGHYVCCLTLIKSVKSCVFVSYQTKHTVYLYIPLNSVVVNTL